MTKSSTPDPPIQGIEFSNYFILAPTFSPFFCFLAVLFIYLFFYFLLFSVFVNTAARLRYRTTSPQAINANN
jgi:hypothetical protein